MTAAVAGSLQGMTRHEPGDDDIADSPSIKVIDQLIGDGDNRISLHHLKADMRVKIGKIESLKMAIPSVHHIN